MTERKECKECGAFDGHGWFCRTPPAEEQITALRRVIEIYIEKEARWVGSWQRMEDRAMMWHGKYAIVKVENNALRRKLYRKETEGKE